MHFSKYPPKSLLLHIPHASTDVPDYQLYSDAKLVDQEINLLTDWATDQIFDILQLDQLVVPFSRVFCDVERLPDKDEPMYKKGAGFYYTQTDDGQKLRSEDDDYKNFIWSTYHQAHHRELSEKIKQKLQNHNIALIVDCHSFSSKPLQREENQSLSRPDICIGTDGFHTPQPLKKQFIEQFSKLGYTVKENMPYSGTIVPLEYLNSEPRVHSLMIEINKKLYMDEDTFTVDEDAVQKLNEEVHIFLNSIVSL